LVAEPLRPSRRPVALEAPEPGALRYELPTRRATLVLARRLARVLRQGDLVILSGDLGAGKTFFTRAVCRTLGIGQPQRITSPTFTLVNEYLGVDDEGRPLPIIHADLYRIGDRDEVCQLGLRDRRSGCLMLVEWGAEHEVELGGGALHLELELGTVGRVATLRGTASSELCERVVRAMRAAP
jgi:tRNA threonylcarbamoyladenosine biosynthesis protein TsaE